jgi:hypothetical protein
MTINFNFIMIILFFLYGLKLDYMEKIDIGNG